MMKLHPRTRAILRIVNGVQMTAERCEVDIDEYVPLRCTTREESLGTGYVRLGNFSTTLMELEVVPQTQVLRGVTVTSIEGLSPWPEIKLSSSVEALPVLSTTFQTYEVVDLEDSFEVSLRRHEILVHWTDLAGCIGYWCDDVCFLSADGILAGIWFVRLPIESTNLFASHGRRQEA